jgi:hypothetical protein
MLRDDNGDIISPPVSSEGRRTRDAAAQKAQQRHERLFERL